MCKNFTWNSLIPRELTLDELEKMDQDQDVHLKVLICPKCTKHDPKVFISEEMYEEWVAFNYDSYACPHCGHRLPRRR